MSTMTFQIHTVNRVGITHDVIECFTSANVDIIGMDVLANYISLKISTISDDLKDSLLHSIRQVIGVKEVALIHYLPSEEREKRMNTILATISEGIISLDPTLNIRTLNRAAEEMLHIGTKNVIGKSYINIFKKHSAEMERCLKEGIQFQNIQIDIAHQNGTSYFIANYYPIPASEIGMPCLGVIIVLRDMLQIQKLIQSVQRSGVLTLDGIVHESNPMGQCIETAKKIAKMNATVFLYGESGTGKDLFARAIHYESPRANNPFIPINCAALPESLLESELFGYEEGAFTGAVKGGKKGLFEMAQGGTLFLDEIGEMPMHLQAKLLRVLEDRTIRRIGSQQTVSVNVRIITATNRNLAEMTKQGKFREDLYYRLHVIPIYIPPLRERKSDILLLSEFFLKKFCQMMNRKPLVLSHKAIQLLQTYHWPGNVRELQNVIERTVYLCPEEISEIGEIKIDTSSRIDTMPINSPLSLKEQIDAYEKSLLENALNTYKTARQTAIHLGLSHTAILNKMRKYHLC